MNPNENILRKLAEVPRVSSMTGTFLQMVSGLARVNLQGSTVDLKCDGWTPPVAGQNVRVDALNGILRVVGPAGARSAVGVVVSSVDGDTRAVVTVDGKDYTLPVMAPYVPLPTDQVVIDWQSGFILGEQATTRVDPTVPPAPSPVRPFTDLLVQATDSGRYNTGGSSFGDSNVWTGTSTRGLWVYSNGFNALAGASFTQAQIYLPLIRQQNNMSFGIHTYPTKPGSDPGFTVSAAHGGARSGWVDLPAGWAEILRDNPSYGIGVFSPGGGFNQWVGRGGDPLSGATRFAGTR